VQDAGITLPARDESTTHDFRLQVPGIIEGSRSVLSFMLEPSSFGVTYTMSILHGDGPPTTIISPTVVAAQTGHVRQEVIGPNVLNAPGNVLRVEVTVGGGTFSDIVLLYQTSV
jgi:hypothetical protein